jgi:hypothetical protein
MDGGSTTRSGRRGRIIGPDGEDEMDGGRAMPVLRLDSDLLKPNRTVMGVKPIIRRDGASRSASRKARDGAGRTSRSATRLASRKVDGVRRATGPRKGKSGGDGSRSISRSASRKARDGVRRATGPAPHAPMKNKSKGDGGRAGTMSSARRYIGPGMKKPSDGAPRRRP